MNPTMKKVAHRVVAGGLDPQDPLQQLVDSLSGGKAVAGAVAVEDGDRRFRAQCANSILSRTP